MMTVLGPLLVELAVVGEVDGGCVADGIGVAVRVGLGVSVTVGDAVHAAPAVAQQFMSVAYHA